MPNENEKPKNGKKKSSNKSLVKNANQSGEDLAKFIITVLKKKAEEAGGESSYAGKVFLDSVNILENLNLETINS